MNLVQILADVNPCGDLLPVVQFVRRGIFPIIQIGIPIILIIMGTVDLGKAVMSSDDKEIKGATSKLIKRAIAAIAVFFISTIVSLLMGMFDNIDDSTDNFNDTGNWSSCWNAAK